MCTRVHATPGHKFDCHHDEHLYHLVNEGYSDEEIGSVDRCGSWHALIEFACPVDRPAGEFHTVAAIITEDNLGFVYVKRFTSEHEDKITYDLAQQQKVAKEWDDLHDLHEECCFE
jgi:hypothetical protein